MKCLIALLLLFSQNFLKSECHNFIEIDYMGTRDYPIQNLQIRKDSCEIPFSWDRVPIIKTVVVPDTVYNYIINFIQTKDYIKNPKRIDTVDTKGWLEVKIDSASKSQGYVIPFKPECNLFLMKLITRFELGIGVPYYERKSQGISDMIDQLKLYLSILYVE